MPNLDKETLTFLEENPHQIHFDEELTKYQFVQGELVITPLKKLNTLDQIKEIQQTLLDHSSSTPGNILSLENSWQLLLKEYNINRVEKIDEREEILAPFSSFRYWVGLGFYPPPETLLAILNCFETYMILEGKLELEEIFFGKKKPGIGNYSARLHREKIMKHFHAKWQLDKTSKGNSKTQSELAKEFIERFNLLSCNEEDYVDSFLRQYRRFVEKNK